MTDRSDDHDVCLGRCIKCENGLPELPGNSPDLVNVAS